MVLHLVDPDASMSQQAETMARACEEIGFFRLPLSVVPRAVADEAWTTARDFFVLPEHVKRRVEFPEPGYPYGWSPYRYETLASSLGDDSAEPDLKESLSVGPDSGAVVPAGQEETWVRSPSLWPEEPVGLRRAWGAYYRALSEVAAGLMRVMAVALELPADHFDRLIDRPISSMRALHYPAVTDDPGGSLRAGAHTDYGTWTVLRTDDVAGLEIRDRDGSWLPVEATTDTFVVNLGDTIEQWTNGRWRSTMHRVSLTSSRPRQSFAFFHMANWDATIQCLPTCRIDGQEPLHPPVQAGPWLMEKYRSTV
ncbi:MAG: isopenicillin N synthase family dioxygenase [Acidimicrobiales bacterium]